MKDAKAYAKEARELRHHLEELTTATENFLTAFEKLMKEPPAYRRGRRIALLINELDLAKDRAKYFGLGIPLIKKGEEK